MRKHVLRGIVSAVTDRRQIGGRHRGVIGNGIFPYVFQRIRQRNAFKREAVAESIIAERRKDATLREFHRFEQTAIAEGIAADLGNACRDSQFFDTVLPVECAGPDRGKALGDRIFAPVALFGNGTVGKYDGRTAGIEQQRKSFVPLEVLIAGRNADRFNGHALGKRLSYIDDRGGQINFRQIIARLEQIIAQRDFFGALGELDIRNIRIGKCCIADRGKIALHQAAPAGNLLCQEFDFGKLRASGKSAYSYRFNGRRNLYGEKARIQERIISD